MPNANARTIAIAMDEQSRLRRGIAFGVLLSMPIWAVILYFTLR